jgi:hypothetical protein
MANVGVLIGSNADVFIRVLANRTERAPRLAISSAAGFNHTKSDLEQHAHHANAVEGYQLSHVRYSRKTLILTAHHPKSPKCFNLAPDDSSR